jgi:hypothetical protein
MQYLRGEFMNFVLLVWLAAALLLAATGLFFEATPQMVAATVWGLTAIGALILWLSPRIRRAVLLLDLRALIALHLVRFVGIAFVALYLAGRLPFSFGVVGGLGDIVIAIGAVILLNRYWRGFAIAWNAAGLIDIVSVVAMAFREGIQDPAAMAPLRSFPLMLLPAYFVPLIILSHGMIFMRLFSSASRVDGSITSRAASM